MFELSLEELPRGFYAEKWRASILSREETMYIGMVNKSIEVDQEMISGFMWLDVTRFENGMTGRNQIRKILEIMLHRTFFEGKH